MRIERAGPADAGEILTVQRAGYVTEAQLYGDPFLPPLVDSLDRVLEVIKSATVLKAVEDDRIIGAVRGQVSGATCVVGRLVVAPDSQGRGGTTLLTSLHEAVPGAAVFDLFTGHLSGSLRLYRRLGYRETRRERVHDHLTLIHLRKERA